MATFNNPTMALPTLASRSNQGSGTSMAAMAWLGAQTLALWPHAHWAWQRVTDGSDDPLGVVAAAFIVATVVHQRHALRQTPQVAWLVGAVVLTLLATAAHLAWPPLPAAMLAALGLACGLAAWLPTSVPRAPMAGLALLALPLISSLQYYVGYPLRLLTAQLSAWGLQVMGVDATRQGASMMVNGQWVVVDAPCSGVQMVWMAYFAACAAATLGGLRDATFLRRLPMVGALVLLGNAVRNTVLVALEARPQGLTSTTHEAIGLGVLAAVIVAVLLCMKPGDKPREHLAA